MDENEKEEIEYMEKVVKESTAFVKKLIKNN